MDSTSSFSEEQQAFPDAELLSVGGTTCQCYRVRLYGKLHFLKRLKPELRTHPQYVAALQKEFETGYSLDHPHLVRYVSKTDDGILMDYVDGETLSQFAESHPDYFKSRKNADRFLRQLLSVVGYLHIHQIVHLDLKPANILITRVGNDVKLVDLGYCYADCYTDTMGRTDKYAAPEQLDGSAKVDARTDIYAIGKILKTLPCAYKYNKMIQRCTRIAPVDRYQSTEEIMASLKQDGRWWWALIALLVVLLPMIILFLNQPQTVTPTETIPLQETNGTQPSSAEDTILRIEKQARMTNADTPDKAELDLTVKEDTLALRRELQAIAQPYFDEMLASYCDSSYKAISHRYTELSTQFREAIMSKYHVLWEKKYRHTNNISERTFYRECAETWLFYVNNLYYEMQRNDGNHSYDGKEYLYYDDLNKK